MNLKKEPVVTVIGLGLIGGSICYSLKKNGINTKGVSKKDTIKKAFDLGIIDSGYEYSEIKDALDGSNFVFICTPLMDIKERIPDVIGTAKKGTIISDVGSTKAFICHTAEKCLNNFVYFIGGHPMAGSEKRGIENANPYLFYDAVYVLTPLNGTPRRIVKNLSSLISLMGAKVMILDPDLHDRIAASISHLPQLLAVLLTNHIADKDNDLYRNLAAGGFRDMTRIASSSYEVWNDIIKTNLAEIKLSLKDFQKEIKDLDDNLENEKYLFKAFERANKERRTIPKYSKGFLKTLFDVRVNIKDKKGELARITNIIYYHNINVKDIEIVNIREGEGGILRIGFSEKADALESAKILKRIGYEVVVIE